MDKVFRVELSGGNRRYCELDLPATTYEMLDALERLQLKPGDKPEWEIIEHTSFQFLHVHLTGECDLYQLNTLAARLSQMNNSEKIAFEGLFTLEVAKKYGPISIATMVDLAYSTDCCHVLPGITTDAQLGEYFIHSGFLPEIDELSEELFQALDINKLGQALRTQEKGLLVSGGYVVRHLQSTKQVYSSLDLVPKVPDYTIRLLVGRYPFETNGQPDKPVPLDLPATPNVLAQALENSGAASWEEAVFYVEDCAIPGLFENMDCEDIHQMNDLAQVIKYRKDRDELLKLKAVLRAADCHCISAAISIAENLDDYFYESDQRTAEEVAMEELHLVVDEAAVQTLQKHVDLFGYGKDLILQSNAMLTPYGLVAREDGGMLQVPTAPHTQGGMQMQ